MLKSKNEKNNSYHEVILINKNQQNQNEILNISNSVKLAKLNKNLKLEIFDFLRINEVFSSIINLNKAIRENIKHKIFFQLFFNYYKYFLEIIDFNEKNNEKFNVFDESINKINDLKVYLLIMKFKKLNNLSIKGNFILKIGNFDGYLVSQFIREEKVKLKELTICIDFFEQDRKILNEFFNLLKLKSSINKIRLSSRSEKIVYINNQINSNKNFKNFHDVNTLKGSEISNNFEKYYLLNLCESIKNYKSIISLRFSDIKLNEEFHNINAVGKLLSLNICLIKLDLSNNNLGGNIHLIKSLFLGLIENKNIKKLNLRNIDLGKYEQNILYLINFMKSNSSLYKLDLGSNNLNNINVNLKKLFEVLSFENKDKINNIKNLDLSNNNLGNIKENINYISYTIIKNDILKNFNLSGNSIGYFKESFEIIINAVLKNKTLQKINFSKNLLNSKNTNTDDIIKLLINNNKIKKFNIKDNSIRIISFEDSINSKLIKDDFFI